MALDFKLHPAVWMSIMMSDLGDSSIADLSKRVSVM